MRKIISLLLVFSFLIPSFPALASKKKTSHCENGECIPGLVDRLEDLNTLYGKQCLPKGIKESDIEKYHLENGLSEECWKIVTEVKHLEEQLLAHQNRLESRLGCEGGKCSAGNETINAQLADLNKVQSELACTEPKKKQVRASCGSDMTCVLMSTALGFGGYIAEKLVPAKAKPKGCHLGNDSCLTQLATGFLKATMTFFEGAWGLLKSAGKYAGKKMGQFWNWVRGAENHSSTSQLAMAKASEDKGVFKMLLEDFPGTMKKIWGGFVASMKEWLQTSVFCQKWSGVPQFSQCLVPTTSIACLPCKTMVTGLCSVTGTVVAEIVPSFLTGGLVSAAKHGAAGAVKIAKLFKVSNSGMKAIKASRISKLATQSISKIDDVLRISRGLTAAKIAISAALKALRTYMISPARKVLKTSFTAMNNALRKSTMYVAQTPTGKVLLFSKDAIKKTTEVILYPIDNPMTTFAFKQGERSFDKLFRLGAPRLAKHTLATASIVQRSPQMDEILARLQKAKISKSSKADDILKLEKQLLETVEPYRREILKSVLLDDDANLSDIIKNLYPEVQYDDLAKAIPKEKVAQAEKEIFLEISRMPDGPSKQAMLSRYQRHVAPGVKRSAILDDIKNPFDDGVKVTLDKSEAQLNFNIALTPDQQALKTSITKYVQESQDEIYQGALRLERKIKASKDPIVYDVVAVGAGPNNGVAVSALKDANPDLRVLVIESSDSMGTFNKIKGFDINTPEFIGNSGNTFPSSPVQLKDFNIADASFASAEDLGHLTVTTYKSSNADMIFNNRVVSWYKEPHPGAWPAKYKITTSNGVSVYTNSGIVGTGFGPPITRLKDADSIALVTKYEKEMAAINLAADAKYAPKATSVDEFLTVATKDSQAGRNAMARYKGKKVLVIGSGDGGNIAVEATAGLNKALNPNNLDTGIETIWLGQDYATGKEFLESLSTRKNLRYSRIAEAMDSGKVKSVNGYLARVEEFVTEAGEKKFKAFYTLKDGTPVGDPVIVDHLVFATGYPNNHSTMAPVFKSIGSEVSFEPVKGSVANYTRYEEFKGTSEITKQLTINGQQEDVWAVGTFAKTEITDADWKVPTGGFLDITAPRAAATGELVAQKLTPQKLSKAQVKALLQVDEAGKVQFIKRPLRPKSKLPAISNTRVADIHTQIEISRSLRGFKTVPHKTFSVSVTKGKKGMYVFNVSGLEKKSVEEVLKALTNNASLTHGLDAQFALGRTKVTFDLTARSTGSLSFESMKFNAAIIALPVSTTTPMNILGGVKKIITPAMEEEQKKKEETKKELH